MIRDCRLIVTMDSQDYLKLLYKSTGWKLRTQNTYIIANVIIVSINLFINIGLWFQHLNEVHHPCCRHRRRHRCCCRSRSWSRSSPKTPPRYQRGVADVKPRSRRAVLHNKVHSLQTKRRRERERGEGGRVEEKGGQRGEKGEEGRVREGDRECAAAQERISVFWNQMSCRALAIYWHMTNGFFLVRAWLQPP